MTARKHQPTHAERWHDQGLCRSATADPNWWFPVERSEQARADTETAVRLCEQCPVRAQCANLALATNEHHGVWGGIILSRYESTRQRRDALRRIAGNRADTTPPPPKRPTSVFEENYQFLRAQGRNHQQIADQLGISLENLYVRMNRQGVARILEPDEVTATRRLQRFLRTGQPFVVADLLHIHSEGDSGVGSRIEHIVVRPLLRTGRVVATTPRRVGSSKVSVYQPVSVPTAVPA